MKILITIFLFSLITRITTPTTIGITYNPTQNPSPEKAAATIQSLNITAVRLSDPDPPSIQAFSNTNISLLLSISNFVVSEFASSRATAMLWLHTHVVPFYPESKITAVSVGEDFIKSDDNNNTDLIESIRNLHDCLLELSLSGISVSTTFSFDNIVNTPFPASDAEFSHLHQIEPVLDFLAETKSSFMVNLYPFWVYESSGEIPIGYALFQEGPFNFHDDIITGARYRNVFDSMVDAVIWALETAEYPDIPVIVAETGWPTSMGSEEPHENEVFAGMYVNGLIRHLKSGLGTPMRKGGAVETYLYELFDTDDGMGEQWGIMYENMTSKYQIEF